MQRLKLDSGGQFSPYRPTDKAKNTYTIFYIYWPKNDTHQKLKKLIISGSHFSILYAGVLK
ncbi:hypothetical protein [Levilactobacillus fujinensis]|nr:hypothetical protein [Levilactobacillus fujinensis]